MQLNCQRSPIWKVVIKTYRLKPSSENRALPTIPQQKEKTPKLFIISQVNIALFNYSVYLVICGFTISKKHVFAPAFASPHTSQFELMPFHTRYLAAYLTSACSAVSFTQ